MLFRSVGVSATGSVLVDPAIGAAGDVDTATATLRTKSGKIAVITNSRRATYGYDQRIEVHGSKGAVSAANVHNNTVTVANKDGYHDAPLLDFFMERYAAAYRTELQSFVKAILTVLGLLYHSFQHFSSYPKLTGKTEADGGMPQAWHRHAASCCTPGRGTNHINFASRKTCSAYGDAGWTTIPSSLCHKGGGYDRRRQEILSSIL